MYFLATCSFKWSMLLVVRWTISVVLLPNILVIVWAKSLSIIQSNVRACVFENAEIWAQIEHNFINGSPLIRFGWNVRLQNTHCFRTFVSYWIDMNVVFPVVWPIYTYIHISFFSLSFSLFLFVLIRFVCVSMWMNARLWFWDTCMCMCVYDMYFWKKKKISSHLKATNRCTVHSRMHSKENRYMGTATILTWFPSPTK